MDRLTALNAWKIEPRFAITPLFCKATAENDEAPGKAPHHLRKVPPPPHQAKSRLTGGSMD